MTGRLQRLSIGIAGVVAACLLAGVAFESLMRSRLPHDFPPPGRLVDIGGRRIQIDCRGSGSPTVVLEAGYGDSGASSWYALHDDIAAMTRACSYSRAGMMWSDPDPRGFSLEGNAEDLHRALEAAGERGPFVMVAHSLGGSYAVTYTGRFGAEVAGLVLVDTPHPDQFTRLETAARKAGIDPSLVLSAGTRPAAIGFLARVGILRLLPLGNFADDRMPADLRRAVRAYLPTTLDANFVPQEVLTQAIVGSGRFRDLGARPVAVLYSRDLQSDEALAAIRVTRAQMDVVAAEWRALHEDMARWSSNGWSEGVPKSGHYIQRDQPAAVLAQVRRVVLAVRNPARAAHRPPISGTAAGQP